jgi:hypothetical protein
MNHGINFVAVPSPIPAIIARSKRRRMDFILRRHYAIAYEIRHYRRLRCMLATSQPIPDNDPPQGKSAKGYFMRAGARQSLA